MNRRVFVCAVSAVPILIARLVASARAAAAVRRIGWLALDDRPKPGQLGQMLAPLRELGWIEGQNLIVEGRYADGRAELLRPLAEELVRLKVELIVTEGTAAAIAAKSATNTIPIVMRSAGDPVRSGLVSSLSRPGGNITGYSVVAPEADIKRLALLRELLPGVHRVAYLQNSTNPYFRAARKDLEQGCRSLGVEPMFAEVGQTSELENAIKEMHARKAQAVVVAPDNLFFMNRIPLLTTVLRYGLPSVANGSDMLKAGGLLSYSESLTELRRRGAAFIDRILRGARPADLPIEQPTQFDLGINLKTAAALGIVVPQLMLSRADEVIR